MVKINGYEKHFLAKLEGIRTEQLLWLRKFNTGVAAFVIVGQVGLCTQSYNRDVEIIPSRSLTLSCPLLPSPSSATRTWV